MVKKTIISIFTIAFIILLSIVGWHFLSPLFIDVEVQEEDIFANQVDIVNDQKKIEPVKEQIELKPAENTSIQNQSIIENEEIIEVVEEKTELVETFPKLIKEGEFERIDYNIDGSFKIYQLEDLSYVLRVNDLEVLNGPDLHFVLTNEWGDSLEDYVKISGPDIDGEKFANKGSYNVEIPQGVDVENFDNLIIHCVQYNHAFAGARLS